MRTPLALSALCLSSLLLSACQKERSGPPVPLVEPVQVQASTASSAAAETSVPAADSVLAPANETPKPGAAAGRSNDKMTRAQESSAMPMVGQNNDHSAPLAAAKPASAP
jgi:hypothetical protein